METTAWPNRIREWRLSSGKTFRQIGKEAGVTASQIQKLELGDRPLSLEFMRRLAKVFQIKPSELLNAEDVECRLTGAEAAILAEIREIDAEPQLLMTAVRAIIKAIERVQRVSRSFGSLPGDPILAAELADAWAELDDQQRRKALELVHLSRSFSDTQSKAA